MKQGDMEVLVKAFAPVIRDIVVRAVKPVADRLRYLEARELPQGEPGLPGRDGFSLSDFDVTAIDARTVQLSFEGGEERFEVDLKFPVPLYRDVFKDGEEYERGDMVTYGGSLWHCNEATKSKPGADPAWTLAVKRGRDGKDMKGA